MTINKLAVICSGIFVVVFLGLVIAFNNSPKSYVGASQLNFNTRAAMTEVGVTTNGLLLATSTSRTWVEIQNVGNNPEWLGFGVPATKGMGILLNVSSTPFVLDLDHMYTGAISAISDNGSLASSTVTVFSNNNNQ